MAPILAPQGLVGPEARVVSMRQGAAGLAVRGRGLLEARRSVLLDTVAVEARVETMTTDIVVLLAAHQGVAVVVVLAGLA